MEQELNNCVQRSNSKSACSANRTRDWVEVLLDKEFFEKTAIRFKDSRHPF